MKKGAQRQKCLGPMGVMMGPELQRHLELQLWIN